jgi:O-antigen/teichoic acid export membrane protein
MLRAALSTGALAKISGIAVQLVAIPYAVRKMGVEAFGEYALAIALFSWVSLLDIVWGQALVRKTVAAINRAAKGEVTSLIFTALVATAFFVVCGAVLLAGAGALWIMLSGTTLSATSLALIVVSGTVAALRILLSIAARARAAFQQLHIDNLLLLAANLAAVAGVFIVMGVSPSPLGLLLTLFVPALLAQLASGILLYKKNNLLHGRLQFDRSMARTLLSEGRWLALGQVGVMLERQVPIILFALFAMPQLSGQYAVALQLVSISAGALLMVTVPLMPAIADAMHSGETGWWSMRVRWLDKVVLLVGATGVVMAFFFGQEALRVLFGVSEAFTPIGMAALALWITLMLSALCYYTVLMAAGLAEVVGKQLFTYGSLFITCAIPVFVMIGFSGVFVLGSLLTFTCTLIPWKRRSRMLQDANRPQGCKMAQV